MKLNKLFGLFVLLSVPLVLQGCERNLYEEGHLMKERTGLQEKKIDQKLFAKDFDLMQAEQLAAHFDAHAVGEMDVQVLYDPRSRKNSALAANKEVIRIVQLLHSAGVKAVNPSIMPVNQLGHEPQVLVSYQSYNAQAPRDCKLMNGLDNTVVDVDRDYKLGCTMETLFARQVARPKDLLGAQRSSSKSDARPVSNIVSGAQTGERREALGGYTASDSE